MTGDVILHRHTGPDGIVTVTIDQADPDVRIAAEYLIGELRSPCVDALGNRVTLSGVNRTVVYVVDWSSYDPSTRSFRMRRPMPVRAE